MNGTYGSYHYTKYESYILPHSDLDVSCPNIINNKYCPYMIRLCKKIKHYQKWIEAVKKRKGKHDIDTTAKINLYLVDSESFKQIILKSTQELPTKNQLNAQSMEKLHALLNKNIFNITMYANGSSKSKRFLANQLGIKLGAASKLVRIARPAIQSAAQKIEFGELFNEMEKDQIENDYQHIMYHHIKNE
eukprot:449389_1